MDGNKGADIIRLADFRKARMYQGPENSPPAAQTTPEEKYLLPPDNVMSITFEAQVASIKQELASVRNRVKEQMRAAPLHQLKVLAHEFALDAQFLLDESRLISPLSTHENSKILLSNIKSILDGAVGALGGNVVPGTVNPHHYYCRIAQKSVTNIEQAVIHFLDTEIASRNQLK